MFTYNNHSSGGGVGTAFWNCTRVCSVASAVSDSLWPHGLWPSRLLCPWDSAGKNTGVGCHSLLQGIFPIQGLKLGLLCLLHCKQIFYHWPARDVLSEINVHKLCNKTNQYLGWYYWKLEFSLWVTDVTLKMAHKKNLGIQNLTWKYRY